MTGWGGGGQEGWLLTFATGVEALLWLVLGDFVSGMRWLTVIILGTERAFASELMTGQR